MFDVSTRLLPLPLLFVLLGAAAAAIVLLYRLDRQAIPPRPGMWLAALRLAAGLTLLVVLADPIRTVRETGVEKSRLLVVVDASRSFLLEEPFRPVQQVAGEAAALGLSPGDARKASRRELAAQALRSGWAEALRERFDVSFYSLSDVLRPLALDTDPLPAEGGSDLLRPLAEELARRPAGNVSGVILLSDGRHHGPGDVQEELARLARLNVPVVAIGLGSLELPPDLEVESVDATGKVFAGDEVKAQVTLSSVGLGAFDAAVSVLDGSVVLKSATVPLSAGEGRTRLPISFPAGSPGRKKLTFRADPAPGEAFAANNSRDLWIEVLSSKARVLLLDGSPRWEERYLRSSWSRDENVELASFLVTPPPERRLPAEFPRTRDALFAQDILVLGDVEPGLFAKEEVDRLRDFVSARGGTLVTVAGEKSMPYRWADTTLAEALPVRLIDPPPAATAGASLAGEDAKFALTPLGQSAEVTRLVAGRERNIELWGLLPPPRWICPVLGVRPGTDVLATAKDTPVFATRAFGAGRVFWVGIDATWKWRYKFGDELHRRFWGQLVRWAVSRQLTASDEHARLSTDAIVYPPGKLIQVEAWVAPGPGSQDDAGRVDAVLERIVDGKLGHLRLEPIPRSGGRYSAAANLDELGIAPDASRQAGEYRVRLEIPAISGYGATTDRATARFAVEPEVDLETRDLGCGKQFLENLSGATGGRFLPLSLFREATKGLSGPGQSFERVSTRSLIDRPGLVAALLLGCLTLEWILRKRHDLV